MTSMKTRKAIRWLGLAVMASVAVYGYMMVQQVRDRHEVAKMTAKMKTVCVGRFLIDLPANAEYSLNRAFVDGFNVSGFDESSEQFHARVAAREAEISAGPNQLGRKNLESVKTVSANGFIGKIFTFGRNSSYMMDGGVKQVLEEVKLEGYAHAGGKSFNFIAPGYDPDLTGNLEKLIDKLRMVPAGAIPTAPGLCFGQGMLLDPISADQAEKIVMFAGLPGHPDLAIALSTMAGLKRTWPTLLQRQAEFDARQPLSIRMRFSKLRSGPRTVSGLTGEEAAVKVTEMNFSVVYAFDWELAGTENDVLAPEIHLEMSTGHNPQAGGPPVRSNVGQQALLELWDKMLSSIRVRPTEALQASDEPVPDGPQIGSFASAGEICPQSGWWVCSDGSEGVKVLGGKRQYLRKGQRMPQALLLPPPTLWEKVRGLQPSYESKTPTPWKLADKRSRQGTVAAAPLVQATLVDATAGQPLGQAETIQLSAVAAIGSFVRTGAVCTASGWWRCQETEALDGTRWFGHGVLLPAATFSAPPGILKNANGPSLIQRRTVWQLVRLDKGSSEPQSGKDGKAQGEGPGATS
jgi:hypothetical protein